jgi:SPP1 gp7 family putative phage head morphogenesis protein
MMKIKPPLGIGAKYRAELRKLNKLVQADINAELVPALERLAPLYQRDGWGETIASIIARLKAKWSDQRVYSLIGEQFVQAVDLQNLRQFERAGINIYGGDQVISDFLQSSTVANVSLIRSLPNQYLSQVESMVMANTTAGLRPEVIKKQLQAQYGLSDKRAKLIARDQTSKLAGNLNEKRQREAGFEYFRWLDSGDRRVRDRHDEIADKVTEYGKGVYRWDYLPLDEKGVPVAPGQPIMCRCTAIPVSQAEVDRNKKAGRTAPGVKR